MLVSGQSLAGLMFGFFGRNWGNLASVAGLVFSALAFVFAKRASKAAREARDSVLLQSLGEEMNAAKRTASDIVTYVGIERGEMALLRVGELMNQTSYMLARWNARLSVNSRNNLLSAREQLRSVHQKLTRNAIQGLPLKDKTRLAQVCQHVNAVFSEEYGTA